MVAMLAGCSSLDMTSISDTFEATDSAEAAAAQAEPIVVAMDSLSALHYQPITVYDQALEQEITLNKTIPVLNLADGSSVALGWALQDSGVYRFKLESAIKRDNFGTKATAFMPEVLLLDKNFQVLRSLPASKLQYQEPGLMEPEYFYHSFIVDNRDPMLEAAVYMAVRMSNEDREFTMEVVNQDEEYAEVRGFMPPYLEPVMATASPYGDLTLTVTPLAIAYRADPAPKPAYVPPVPTHENSLAPVVLEQYDTIGASKQYRAAVEAALAEGDIQKALSMRKYVQELDKDLQALFTSLYNHKSMTIDEFVSGDEFNLSTNYAGQMQADLAAGQTQNALLLLDQIQALSTHISALF